MTAYRQILRGARSALSSMGTLTRQEWDTYVGNLYLSSDFPGMQGLGYAPRVPAERLAEHTARMQNHGYAQYAVWPAGQRAQFAPVARMAPASAHAGMIGMDLLSRPELRDAMSHSASAAITRLSQPLQLASGGQAQQSSHVFMVQPLYSSKRSMQSANPEQDREASLVGWVFGLFQTSSLVAQTLGQLPPNLRLTIHAGPLLTPATLLYESSQPLNWHGRRPLQVVTPLDMDGQRWVMVFEGFPRAYANQSAVNGEWLAIVLICLLFSLSVVLITQTLRNAGRLLELTDDLQASNERYQFLATHDALTDVANRSLFQDRLEVTLLEAARYGHQFALIYLDLDHFKPVNDQLGHRIGDQLLVQVTQRLKALLRGSDLLARRGGDEFVLLLPKLESASDAQTVATKVCAELARPFVVEGHILRISSSLGIAVYPDDAVDAEALIHAADQFMYQAKAQGRNRWISAGKASHAA